MIMKEKKELTIDALLRSIEFPGEDPEAIRRYLADRGFVDSVMCEVYALKHKTQRTGWWLLFATMNLLILVVLGIDPSVVFSRLDYHATLSQFFFLFLGITLLGSVIGIIITMDAKKVDDLVGRIFGH
jgi:hypothetical protein